MDLSDFNIKNLEKNLLESKSLSSIINSFINELKDYLEKGDNKNMVSVGKENKYSNYWEYQNFMEDNVSAKIGLSRWGNNITYSNDLSKAVDNSILEISKKEGTLYRKQFIWNGSNDGGFYNVDKFKNGRMIKITIPKELIPDKLENKDIIFQYDKKGNIKVREDLKEKAINLASDKSKYLKEKETNRNNEFKKEGHIYEVFEDDGYVFLNDLTEERDFLIEDIDFVVDNYKGDGRYQVINGEYQKMD